MYRGDEIVEQGIDTNVNVNRNFHFHLNQFMYSYSFLNTESRMILNSLMLK